MTSLETVTFDVGTASYDRNSTLHYRDCGGAEPPRENQDSVRYLPGVGLFVADGAGGEVGGAIVSKLTLLALEKRADILNIRNMSEGEAVDAVHDTLYYADNLIGNYKADRPEIENAATTLGALIFARHHLIAVGIGDTPVFRFGSQKNAQGLSIPSFSQLTEEQCQGIQLTNQIDGQGRPPYASREGNDVLDIVESVPIEPGNRYIIATDGLLGDKPQQRIPLHLLNRSLFRSNLAQGAADILAFLPARLRLEQASVEVNGSLVPYEPKFDDLSVATLFVNGPENRG